jgi:hypothetical protein
VIGVFAVGKFNSNSSLLCSVKLILVNNSSKIKGALVGKPLVIILFSVSKTGLRFLKAGLCLYGNSTSKELAY